VRRIGGGGPLPRDGGGLQSDNRPDKNPTRFATLTDLPDAGHKASRNQGGISAQHSPVSLSAVSD